MDPDGGHAPIVPRLNLSSLSTRERDVLALLCRGCSRSEIASRLYRSPKTIDNHCTRIYTKLGVQSQAQLVSLMYESGQAQRLEAEGSAGLGEYDVRFDERVHQALIAIEAHLSATDPADFFQELSSSLAAALGTEMAGASELDERADQIRVIAASDRGAEADRLVCTREDSACGETIRLGEFECRREARARFPSFEVFRIAGVESYIGVRLDVRGLGPVGCLWVADREPMEDTTVAKNVLRLLRRRVGTELALQIAMERLGVGPGRSGSGESGSTNGITGPG